ncbi:MAG: tetratricopeptide repeat protein [Fidelibacterota bacterium]
MYSQKWPVLLVSFTGVLFPVILLLGGCAYFNTFYNAQNYFQSAEKEMAKNSFDERLNKKAEEALDMTIVNCNIILEEYPESKLRDDALYLSAKAFYYLGDFSIAKKRLFRLQKEHPESPYLEESSLWLSKCRWKLGETDAALEDLLSLSEKLSKKGGTREQLAQVYVTLGEIYIELGKKADAVKEFQKATRLTRNASIKGQYLLRSGELLVQINQLDNALRIYRQVLKVTTNPERLNKANLEIVRILRILERWDETIKTIQVLLSNEKFTALKSDLNLELARLYEMRGMTQEAISRYTSITEDFQKTEASAQAYYQLGELALSEGDEFEAAKRYYSNVEREKRSSLLVPVARARVKEIEAYLTVINNISVLEAVLTSARLEETNIEKDIPEDTLHYETDSLMIPSGERTAITDTMETIKELTENLYSLGELLAFHFSREDSAIKVLDNLVNYYPNSNTIPQALFTLGHLLRERGDTLEAENYITQLIENYPATEFAIKAAAEIDIILINEAEELLKKAETVLYDDPEKAVETYKRILQEFPESSYVPHALLAIGFTYENVRHNLDSTLNYYSLLIDNFPTSEQAESIQSHYEQLRSAVNQLQADTTATQAIEDTTLSPDVIPEPSDKARDESD